jgi:hypothetical protein
MSYQQQLPKRRFTLTDIVIIVVGLGIVGSLSVSQWQNRHVADTAIVYNNSGEPIRISLLEDHVHSIAGRLGNSELEVSHGRIRFKHSPCSQHVCIHTGWLKESGEAAACLPNGVSLVLHGDTPRYDSIIF